jgi:hypothetical protein
MGSKKKPSAAKRAANRYSALTPPPKTPSPSKRSDSDDDTTDLLPLGTKNADGTIVGGGPLNVHCSKCKAANYPTAYGHGHRSNQRQFCPVLQEKSAAEATENQLSPALDNVTAVGAETARPKSAVLSFPGALKTNGKLMTLYKHTTTQVLQQLHKTGKQEHKQNPVVNLLTGQVTVDTKDDAPITSVAVFMLVLEKFRHMVVTRDYLSESELHSMLCWTHLQLSLNKKLLVVERTLKAILESMDNNHEQDLNDVMRLEAHAFMRDQQDTYDSSFQRGLAPDPNPQTPKGTQPSKPPAAKPEHRARLALEVPNDFCCWYETNGLHCANKIKINGVCKYAHLHGTCGMPKPDGTYCQEKHKAAEHQK